MPTVSSALHSRSFISTAIVQELNSWRPAPNPAEMQKESNLEEIIKYSERTLERRSPEEMWALMSSRQLVVVPPSIYAGL